MVYSVSIAIRLMAFSQSNFLLIEGIWGGEGVAIKESGKDGIRRGVVNNLNGLFIRLHVFLLSQC